MAGSFNLTAQLVMQGPVGLGPIVQQIQNQLNGINTNLNFRIDPQAQNRVNSLNTALTNLNTTLATTQQNATNAAAALSTLGQAVGNINSNANRTNNLPQQMTNIARSSHTAANNMHKARTEMEEFGRQSALAIRRFAAFSVATGVIFGFVRAVAGGVREAVSFERELVKVAQVTDTSMQGLRGLTSEITRLSTSIGASSKDLVDISVTLAQAGLSADDTKTALEALAKSSLSATFGDIRDTTEGAIAVMQQFGITATGLEKALDAINAVSGKYAVESEDLISAVRRAGGVFAAMSQGVAEGQDALNQFISLFTSVRATTRESAESIATGLRTIFVRLQRGSTIDALRELGIELQDVEGKFVGPFEAIKRLSEALSGQSFRSEKLGRIVEELGGFRQISKVIPLLQQFKTTQEALAVAQQSQGSITSESAKAQQTLQVQLDKTRERFLALMRDITASDTFQVITGAVLKMANSLISLADALKPILPALATLATVKLFSAGSQFLGGFIGGIKSLGGAGAFGQQVSGANQQAASAASVVAATAQTNAVNANTAALVALTGALRTFGVARFPGLRFASGGVVPGSGNTDSVLATLMPGEFVLQKDAVQALGGPRAVSSLNRFAGGGKKEKAASFVPGLASGFKVLDYGAIFLTPEDIKQDQSIFFSGAEIGRKAGLPFTKSADNPVLNAVDSTGNKIGLGVKANLHSRSLPGTVADELQSNLKGAVENLFDVSGKYLSTQLGGKFVPNRNLEVHGLKAIEGYAYEAGLASIGAPFSGVDEQTQQSIFDFPGGLGSHISKAFQANILSDKPTDAKRRSTYDAMASVKGKMLNNIVSRFGLSKKAEGGVSGGELSLLTPGEVVIGKGAAQSIGYANLHKLNQAHRYARGGVVGGIPRYVTGGDVDRLLASQNIPKTAANVKAAYKALAQEERLAQRAAGTGPAPQSRGVSPKDSAPYAVERRRDNPLPPPRASVGRGEGFNRGDIIQTSPGSSTPARDDRGNVILKSPSFLQRHGAETRAARALDFGNDFGGRLAAGEADRQANARADKRAAKAGGVQPGVAELAQNLRKQDSTLTVQAATTLARQQIEAARAIGQDITITKSLGKTKQEVQAILKQQAATEKVAKSQSGGIVNAVKNRFAGKVAGEDIVNARGETVLKAGQRAGGRFGGAEGFFRGRVALEDQKDDAGNIIAKKGQRVGGVIPGIKNRLGSVGTGALLAAPLLAEAIGRKTEQAAAIGGGLTGGVSGAFAGGSIAGPAGAAIGAIIGAGTGALEGARSQREEAAQKKVDDSGKEIDKTFEEFSKTGNIDAFNAALQQSIVALGEQASALAEANTTLGSTGGFYASFTSLFKSDAENDVRAKSSNKAGTLTTIGRDFAQAGLAIGELAEGFWNSITGRETNSSREASHAIDRKQREEAAALDKDNTRTIFENARSQKDKIEESFRKQFRSGKTLDQINAKDGGNAAALLAIGSDEKIADRFRVRMEQNAKAGGGKAGQAKIIEEFAKDPSVQKLAATVAAQIKQQEELAKAYRASNEIGRQYSQVLTDLTDTISFGVKSAGKFDQDIARAEAAAEGQVTVQSKFRVNPFEKGATESQVNAGIDDLRSSGFDVSPEFAGNIKFGKALERALPKIVDDTVTNVEGGGEQTQRSLIRNRIIQTAKEQGVDEKSVVVQQTLNTVDEELTKRSQQGGSNQQLQSGDFQDALEAGAKKAADSYSTATEAAKKAFDERNAAEAKFAENLNKFADLQRKAFAAVLEIGQLEINQRNAMAQLLGKELSVEEQTLAEKTKIGKLGLGETGGADTTVQDIIARRSVLTSRFGDLQSKVDSGQLDIKDKDNPEVREMGELKAQIGNNTEALQLATRSTTTLAAVQNKFAELNQRSAAGRGFVNNLFTMDFQQRLQFNRGARGFGKLISGQGETLTNQDRKLSSEYLQQISPLLSNKTRSNLEDQVAREQINTMQKTGQITDKEATFLKDEIVARAHEREEGKKLLETQQAAAEQQLLAQEELAKFPATAAEQLLNAATTQTEAITNAIKQGFLDASTALGALVAKQAEVNIPATTVPTPGTPTGRAHGGLIGGMLTKRRTDNRYANGGEIKVADGEHIMPAWIVSSGNNYEILEHMRNYGSLDDMKSYATGGTYAPDDPRRPGVKPPKIKKEDAQKARAARTEAFENAAIKKKIDDIQSGKFGKLRQETFGAAIDEARLFTLGSEIRTDDKGNKFVVKSYNQQLRERSAKYVKEPYSKENAANYELFVKEAKDEELRVNKTLKGLGIKSDGKEYYDARTGKTVSGPRSGLGYGIADHPSRGTHSAKQYQRFGNVIGVNPADNRQDVNKFIQENPSGRRSIEEIRQQQQNKLDQQEQNRRDREEKRQQRIDAAKPGAARNNPQANAGGGAGQGQDFSVAASAIKALGTSVDKLVGLNGMQFTIGGTQKVEVVINGAEALAQLEPRIKDIAIANIDKAMKTYWNNDGSPRTQNWTGNTLSGSNAEQLV